MFLHLKICVCELCISFRCWKLYSPNVCINHGPLYIYRKLIYYALMTHHMLVAQHMHGVVVCTGLHAYTKSVFRYVLLPLISLVWNYPEAVYRQVAKSPRDAKNMQDARNSWKKKPAWDNMKIDYTRCTIQLFSRTIKFYPLSHKKIPFCLVHNYCFYRKSVQDKRQEKSVSWSSINNTK